MSWSNNDGPWGPSGGKSGSNPWTKKDQSGGPPSGDRPPDLDDFLRKWRDAFERWLPRIGGPSQLFMLILSILIGLWILSGFYQVATDQVGVVMRFGAFDRQEPAGLRYHLPTPIEDVLLPTVTSQNEIAVGFRHSTRTPGEIHSVPEESMMLTQDENIINVEFAVFWRVSDVGKFLFEIRDPEQTVKMAAESTMREVIGQNKLQFELTDGREQVAEDARIRLQKLMDEYNAGVVITEINLQTVSVPEEVKAAFQDVVNARLDQERFQNEAAAHANKVIPEAKGQSAKITQQAMGYRDQKIALAQGDADRFKEVLIAYDQAREVTVRRLYLETMESVLGNANKIIVDKAGSTMVPYTSPSFLLAPRGAPQAPALPNADGGAK